MLEFMLSRSIMSMCAVIVVLTISPLVVSVYLHGDDCSGDSLEELASRFEEFAMLTGEASVRIGIRDYLNSEGDHFLLYQGSIWLIGIEGSSVHTIPFGYRILTSQSEVQMADLGWNSVVTLTKWSGRNGTTMEAHIENFEDTSLTRSANLSTSSRVL